MPTTDSTPDTTETAPETPDATAFNLTDWIQGMSPTLRSVTIYGRTDIFGRYEHLLRELEVAEKVAAHPEASITDGDRVAEITAEIEDLYRVQQESKTTWYVQALDSDVIRAINDEHDVPTLPEKPKEPQDNAPQSVKDKYRAAKKKYDREHAKKLPALQEAVNERNLHYIAAAVVRIEDHQGRTVATSVTVEQIRALEATTHGAMQTGRLLTAASEAKTAEPVIPAPFSRSSSKGTPG